MTASPRFPSAAAVALALAACGDAAPPDAPPPPEPAAVALEFQSRRISDVADLWWARTLADVNADGIVDVVLQNANGSGGWLGWLEGSLDAAAPWTAHVIAEGLEDGRRFAAGDLDTGDFDGDGDVDVLGVVHPGEWTDAAAHADLFWFENPDWTRHEIGRIPNALKDVEVADFDADGRLDVVAITFEESVLTLFRHEADGSFSVAQRFEVENLHEGMDTGDVNGDGRVDIATNGYLVVNPGPDVTAPWEVRAIDPIWHDQTGDWSRNATKVACHDLDGDGDAEVILAHSERAGYPVAVYDLVDESANEWSRTTILEELPAAHSLQVFDFDLDGDPDILTGVNRGRAVNIEVQDFPVYVILNQPGGWEPVRIHDGGVYNALAADFDGDGDVDVFRYPAHDSNELDLMVNQVRSHP